MWCNFEQSPVEDETISNAFSSHGIFQLRCDEEVQTYPSVLAMVQNKKIVVAIDKSLVLLEDELVAKCSFLSFNSNIDVVAISQSGNLIVCALSDGEIHGIFIKGTPLFNVCIRVEDIHMTGRSFVGIQQFDKRFYLTCSNGNVYCLSEIDETPLEANLHISISESETVTFDKTVLDDVSVQRISNGRSIPGLSCATLIPNPTDQSLLIASADNVLHFKSSAENLARIRVSEQYGGVKQIYNLENLVLILTNSGHLLEICPFTKTILFASQQSDADLIDQLIVLESSDEYIELLVLTKAIDNNEREMKFIEYPSFKCNNQLDVTEHSWLVQQPKCSVNLYYLSGKSVNMSNIPNEVEMLLVSETHPNERFKKLIAKGHLEEAEDFGKQFELSLQPIYEAKAKRILVELCNLDENNFELLKKHFTELLDYLQKIENRLFFHNNRMINMPSRHYLEKFLKEMLKHLDEENDEEHIYEISEQLHRLKTLAIIDPYECNIDWQKFVYHNNLVTMITKLFKTDIPTACLIWKRHSSSMMPKLNEKELRKLLGLIPSNTEAFNLIQWLRQFVPTVSSTHPNIMPFITEWSIQKTRALQYSKHWPEIGLEFSTKVSETFEDISFLHSDVSRQHERNVAKLRGLVNALQDLSVLKNSYNLNLTLDNYLQDSIEDTALCILQHVHLDNLKSLVNDFLYPIYQEKGSTPVAAIRRYISFLIANRSSLSTWLERAVACIELLHCEIDRLECALSVLQNSPVPWPDTVTSLLKLRSSTHPLALKINAEYEIQVIKIMKVKYGWPEDSAADINWNLFMFRIVKMDLPDMLNDIRTLTKAVPEIASSANFNCCYQMVRRGKIDEAYEYFKLLTHDTDKKYAKDVSELFAEILENSITLSDDKAIQEQTNLIEFYKLITPHCCGSATHRLLVIQNRFVLRHKFQLTINSITDLACKENRLKYFELAMENIIERSQVTTNFIKFITSELRELCKALDMEKIYGLHRLCQRMRCLPLSCALTYTFLQFCDCTAQNKDDFVALALELIVEQIHAAKRKQNSSSLLMNEIDPLAFALIYDILVSAYMIEQKNPRDLLELIKYVHIASSSYPLNVLETYYYGRDREVNESICKALDEAEIPTADGTLDLSPAINLSFDVKPNTSKKRYSVSVFDDVEMQPQEPKKNSNVNEQLHITRFVSRALLLIIIETVPTNEILLRLNKLLTEEIKNDLDGAREEFFLSLEHLIKVKSHDIWYLMAQYLLDYQQSTNCKKIINSDFVSLQLKRVFRNIMISPDVNFTDLFVMLIADKYAPTILEQLGNDLKTDQQRVNLLILSEMYNLYVDELQNVDAIRTKRIKHYYYMEFCKQDPSIKGKFNADYDNIEQLLKEFHHKQLDVHLLERMSRDFGFDYQKILITQVLSILHAQELQYEIKTDALGDEELVVLSTAEDMRSLCEPYLHEIKNIDLLTAKLKQFIDEINIYFYELYLCVIELLLFFDAVPNEMQVWTSILHFLKHKMITRRRNRPGQLETDMWLQSQKEIGVLPKIARYRLPFKPIVEQPLKDILDSELNVDNCQSWFPLIQMHTVLKGSKDVAQTCDYFSMSAVKNSIAEYKASNESETWHLQPTNNAFLQSILRLVKHVHNPSKAFLILYFVSNYAPDGADQVDASYECYKYVIENETAITDQKCQEQLAKIKRKYPILKTQHLLYVYGLTDEKLMRLIESPADLIYHLYHHELIVKISSKLDMNTVAKEIAKLHNLDIEQIQFKLLQKWLSFTMDTADGTVWEETFFEDHNLAEHTVEDAGSAAENVIRANYILNSWPKKEAIQFLIAHIFPSDGAINTSKQLQTYECLTKLNDGSTSFNSMLSQRQYITIKCVHELKKLGYNFSLEKFADQNCNKIEILKTIWQRNAHNPHSLEIMANICLGFEIYLPKIWNGILKRMVMTNMVRELNALVEILSCKPQFLHTDGLVVAWECVLKHPFNNANQTRSFEQEEQLHKTLFRFQGCPVLHALNLYKFAEICMRLDRTHLAAVIMALCKNERQRLEIKALINARKCEKLRQEILDLEDAGILPVILNFALKELDL